jgi:hypothetical protein
MPHAQGSEALSPVQLQITSVKQYILTSSTEILIKVQYSFATSSLYLARKRT